MFHQSEFRTPFLISSRIIPDLRTYFPEICGNVEATVAKSPAKHSPAEFGQTIVKQKQQEKGMK